ncbi:MAG: hypothetical protein GY839_03070 [candidate division Zixibacteria bacterium]|nr:hypothetical protein [candidate division Zixibacteria bacterium]
MTKNTDKPSAEQRVKEGWIRQTYVVRKETAEKVKRHSYWGRLAIKDIVDTALTEYLKGKNTKPIPDKK